MIRINHKNNKQKYWLGKGPEGSLSIYPGAPEPRLNIMESIASIEKEPRTFWVRSNNTGEEFGMGVAVHTESQPAFGTGWIKVKEVIE